MAKKGKKSASSTPAKPSTKESVAVESPQKKPTPVAADHWFNDPALTEDPLALRFKEICANESNDENAVSHLSTCPPLSSLLAIDCEMVEVASVVHLSKEEEEARKIPEELRNRPKTLLQSQLARVSIVDGYGKVVLDSFVLPTDPVVDYRTEWSGVTPEKLKGAPSFDEIAKVYNKIVTEKSVVVGQSIDNDLKVLHLDIPMERVRDTALFYQRFHPHRRTFGLKTLAKRCLDLDIQDGQHDSIIDARTSLLVYRQIRTIWELTHPLHEPLPANFSDPRPPPIPVLPDLPTGFLAAVEEMRPKAPTHVFPNASTPDATPQTPPPVQQPAIRFSMTGPPTLFNDETNTPIDILDSTDAVDSPRDSGPIATIPFPFLRASPSKSGELTSTQVIKAFYPLNLQGELRRAEKVGVLRLAGAPYWLVPDGSVVDPDVNQVGVDEVLEKIGEKVVVDTSVPGKKKRKREVGEDDGEEKEGEEGKKGGEDVVMDEAASGSVVAAAASPAPLAKGTFVSTRLKHSMQWLASIDEKQKLKKQKEYARKKVRKAEKWAAKVAANGGVPPPKPVKKVTKEKTASLVDAAKQFLEIANGGSGALGGEAGEALAVSETVAEPATLDAGASEPAVVEAPATSKSKKSKKSAPVVEEPPVAVVETPSKPSKSKKSTPAVEEPTLAVAEEASVVVETPSKSKKSKKSAAVDAVLVESVVDEVPESKKSSKKSKKAAVSVEEEQPVAESVSEKKKSKRSKTVSDEPSVIEAVEMEEPVKKSKKAKKAVKDELETAAVTPKSSKKSKSDKDDGEFAKKSKKRSKDVVDEDDVDTVKEAKKSKKSKKDAVEDDAVVEKKKSKKSKKDAVVEDAEAAPSKKSKSKKE
ncbi:3'-5' exonuclease [Podochytrium sp. JEL0797]|nr:3'-5' exonuclease [Podochytrium sp. JEL0797]